MGEPLETLPERFKELNFKIDEALRAATGLMRAVVFQGVCRLVVAYGVASNSAVAQAEEKAVEILSVSNALVPEPAFKDTFEKPFIVTSKVT